MMTPMSEPSPSPLPESTPATATPRRRGLILGVAAAAAVAGAAMAWRRLQPHAVVPSATTDAAAGSANPGATEPENPLWALTLDTPAGTPLALSQFRGKPLLVNFWATWCPPCVAELPLLDRFYKENAANGWQVVGLAVDQLAPVQRFLQAAPVSFPMAMAGPDGMALGRGLGNVVGGLPFSVVVDGAGNMVHRKMGQLSEQDLVAWAGLR